MGVPCGLRIRPRFLGQLGHAVFLSFADLAYDPCRAQSACNRRALLGHGPEA